MLLLRHSSKLFHTISSGAVVDLQDARLEVTEGDGGVPVCAVIRSPDITCPVDFTFTISLSVGDGTLEMIQRVYGLNPVDIR